MKLLIFKTINAAGGECSLDRFTDLMTYNTIKKISG